MKIKIAYRWLASGLLLVAGVAAYRFLSAGGSSRPVGPATAVAPAPLAVSGDPSSAAGSQGFLYGRVSTRRSGIYEGRLRWGGRQEAFWSDVFNGSRRENPWAVQVPPERLPKDRRALTIFGFEITQLERPRNLGRPFVARFGDLARIEARGREVRVTRKGGAVVDLDRLDSSDFDDGVRVWDARRGVVDLDSLDVVVVELLPTPALADVPARLQGTVHTPQGDFTGYLQWGSGDEVTTDVLEGHTAEGSWRLPFDGIRSIARPSGGGLLVTRTDGTEVALTDLREADRGRRVVTVDDPRFGRVQISWGAFERVDFTSTASSGPSFEDFPPSRPLRGFVLTLAGRRLEGRLVFDLDESETTDFLDAPRQGLDFAIPLHSIAAIVLPVASDGGTGFVQVTLGGGDVLELEPAGDFGATNAGMLVFPDGDERPEYLPWEQIQEIRFQRSPD